MIPDPQDMNSGQCTMGLHPFPGEPSCISHSLKYKLIPLLGPPQLHDNAGI